MRQLVVVSDYSFPSLLALSTEDALLLVLIGAVTLALILVLCAIVWGYRLRANAIAHAHEIGRIRWSGLKAFGEWATRLSCRLVPTDR
jgi:hypothetical protein